MSGIITPTRGPWLARPTMSQLPGHLTITSDELPVIATIPPNDDGTPNFANAGVIAAVPHLIEALCEIQMMVRARQASAVQIEQVISAAFEKIYIEADA